MSDEDDNIQPAEFTIKVSTVIGCCILGATILVVLGWVVLTLYQGTLMK